MGGTFKWEIYKNVKKNKIGRLCWEICEKKKNCPTLLHSPLHQYETQLKLVFKTAIPCLFVFKHLEFFFSFGSYSFSHQTNPGVILVYCLKHL